MKHFTKKLTVFLIACIMALSVVGLVACGDSGTKSNIYTVKVVGLDGNPYTSALVQPCEVDANGNLSTCYNGVATDSNGVAVLEIGKHITNDKADHMEIHLLNLPSYLTYTAPRIHRGDEVTITLAKNLKNPSSGKGTGGYSTDGIGNTIFDMSVYDPYIVGEGAYSLKFTSADQKIYFEFHTDYEAVYKVYSVGDIDASVNQLTGTKMTGIYNTNDSAFKNDNVSATDKNFSYEFVVSPSLIEQEDGTGICYFEISLENADGVNKEAIICFEYVDEYEEVKLPDTVNVTTKKNLSPFKETEGSYYIDADLDGTFAYVLGDDGYYHVGDKNGAVVIATLGTDEVKPRGLELSFKNIYLQGQNFIFSDGKTFSYNYYPLFEAYDNVANSEGRYPLTDELIEFFAGYIEHSCSVDWLEQVLNTHLPEGKEWLVWCGYYYEAPSSGGTEEDPLILDVGTLNISVPAGGSVYYAAYTMGAPVTYIFTSDSDNVKLTYYNISTPAIKTVEQSDGDGLYCEVTLSPMSSYNIVFSAKDGAAASYSVLVRVASSDEEPDEGTEENPIEVTYFGEYLNETKEVESLFGTDIQSVYYTYTVAAADAKLYFKAGENTVITVSWIIDEETQVSASRTTADEDELAQLLAGLEFNAGTVLKIEVSRDDWSAGHVSFIISNTPIAD